MHSHGDVDDDRKLIRINPRKGDVVDTILHENLHKLFPKKPEKWIKRKAKEWLSRISITKLIKILRKYD